jgi:hypothetical protein
MSFGVGDDISFRLWDVTAQRKMGCGRCAENQMFLCYHFFCCVRLCLFVFLFRRLEATSWSYLQCSSLSILLNISTLKDEYLKFCRNKILKDAASCPRRSVAPFTPFRRPSNWKIFHGQWSSIVFKSVARVTSQSVPAQILAWLTALWNVHR